MFRIEFLTNSTAFKEDNPDTQIDGFPESAEIVRILATIIDEVLSLETSEIIQDYNGNTIGKWSLSNKEGK